MRVTLDMFSGRPNPSWELTQKEADNLVDMVSAAPATVAAHPPMLGFRGFIVEPDLRDRVRRPGVPLRFGVAATAPPTATEPPSPPTAKRKSATARRRTSRLPETRAEALSAASDYLLQTAERAVSPDLVEVARQHPASPNVADTAGEEKTEAARERTGRKKRGEAVPRVPRTQTHTNSPELRSMSFALSAGPADATGCNPLLTPMNLGYWDQPPIRFYNNCYNYAMNFASNTVAQPGRRAGRPYRAFDCDEVRAAALTDGCLEACVDTVRVVALAIWPGVDFHWYRLHPGGFWAHKLGITDVWTRDNFGRIIGNGLTPETCDRGPYAIFCGFFYAPLGIQVF